jgi:hypothetical protein
LRPPLPPELLRRPPEGEDSGERTLLLLYRLATLADADGAHIVYPTHPPLVAALPGTQIVKLSEDGIRERALEEPETVGLRRRFSATRAGFSPRDGEARRTARLNQRPGCGTGGDGGVVVHRYPQTPVTTCEAPAALIKVAR